MSAARRTKAELTADLEAAHVAYQALRTQYESLQGELHDVRVQLVGIKRTAPAVALTSPYREAMAKAKALAMSTGRCVSVAR